jgi:hypothetical protein
MFAIRSCQIQDFFFYSNHPITIRLEYLCTPRWDITTRGNPILHRLSCTFSWVDLLTAPGWLVSSGGVKSHHMYGKFCHYAFMERNVFDLLWCCLQALCLTWLKWCDIVWLLGVMRQDLVWFGIVIAKTYCSPGGTLGVHGRNPSEGSAWSARPAV